jgi:aspartate-semialdehyde dehydrogenase
VTRIAVVDAGSLVGQSLKEALESRAEDSFDVRLLTSEEAAAGTLAEIQGEPALVQTLAEESMAEIDLVALCGAPAQQHRALAQIDEEVPVFVLATHSEHPGGELRVAGINDSATTTVRVTVSPLPGVIALAHLLGPLRELGLSQATATVITPGSTEDTAGLDEIFEQTRAILAFSGDVPSTVFGHQLAFNLLPGPSDSDLSSQVTEILGTDFDLAVQTIRAGVFHGLAIGCLVRLGTDIETPTVVESLVASPYIEPAESPETLGPIDSASRVEILLGPVHARRSRAGEFWIWAVMDNLTRGGADNAAELIRAASQSNAPEA